MEGDMVVRKYEGYSGRMICGTLLERWEGDMRDGPPPRNRPGRAAVFGPNPPQSTKNGKQERQTICEFKKECLFCI